MPLARALMVRIEGKHTTLVPSQHLLIHACITPIKRSKAPFLVPLLCLPTLGATLECHRRRYCLDEDIWLWVKVWCATAPRSYPSPS